MNRRTSQRLTKAQRVGSPDDDQFIRPRRTKAPLERPTRAPPPRFEAVLDGCVADGRRCDYTANDSARGVMRLAISAFEYCLMWSVVGRGCSCIAARDGELGGENNEPGRWPLQPSWRSSFVFYRRRRGSMMARKSISRMRTTTMTTTTTSGRGGSWLQPVAASARNT
uniref:Uncharacterized protein n=1 Tax=Plectus sambesii TaxID=2011161 RepID=A0A914XFN5_9BILA